LDEVSKVRFLMAVDELRASFIADRGLLWEMHVDETLFSLWTIRGLAPAIA
jgi:hypothetical protein